MEKGKPGCCWPGRLKKGLKRKYRRGRRKSTSKTNVTHFQGCPRKRKIEDRKGYKKRKKKKFGFKEEKN